MHCNLRPSDVVPVVLRLNYEARTKFEVPTSLFLTCNVFTADTLRYAMTLTSDTVTPTNHVL